MSWHENPSTMSWHSTLNYCLVSRVEASASFTINFFLVGKLFIAASIPPIVFSKSLSFNSKTIIHSLCLVWNCHNLKAGSNSWLSSTDILTYSFLHAKNSKLIQGSVKVNFAKRGNLFLDRDLNHSHKSTSSVVKRAGSIFSKNLSPCLISSFNRHQLSSWLSGS